MECACAEPELLPAGIPASISTYQIGPVPKTKDGSVPKLKVRARPAGRTFAPEAAPSPLAPPAGGLSRSGRGAGRGRGAARAGGGAMRGAREPATLRRRRRPPP